jgi:hypothetical protein
MACPSQPPCRFDTKVESQIQHSEKTADSVNPENALGLKECLVGLGQKLVNARQPPAPLAGFAATSPKMERAPAAGQEAEARRGKG